MKRSIMSGLLVASMIAGAVLPAMSQERRPPPEGGHEARDGKPGGPRGDHDRGGPGGNPGLKLAGRLSVLETYIGVTPEQEPAWRAYSDALIAFAGAEGPGHGPGNGPGKAPGPDGKPPAPRLMGENIAERAIAAGQKAEVLQAAAVTLRAALSEDQLARLIAAEAPPHGPGMGPGKGPGEGPGRGGAPDGQPPLPTTDE